MQQWFDRVWYSIVVHLSSLRSRQLLVVPWYLSLVTTRSIHQPAQLTKWRPAASDLIIVSLVVVIVHFLNCFNNFSRFRYSYMYIMMFLTYICIFSDKLPSHIQTFGLLLILSRFIGLPRYSYQPVTIMSMSHCHYRVIFLIFIKWLIMLNEWDNHGFMVSDVWHVRHNCVTGSVCVTVSVSLWLWVIYCKCDMTHEN